ncbi:hypothetical protein L1887_15243 [Cichorium endivia]|nr:hypothetical protein L1887_15243 [Cichorium endivia]
MATIWHGKEHYNRISDDEIGSDGELISAQENPSFITALQSQNCAIELWPQTYSVVRPASGERLSAVRRILQVREDMALLKSYARRRGDTGSDVDVEMVLAMFFGWKL